MKYVNFTLQEMTPEKLKQNPITVPPNQKLDTEEGSQTQMNMNPPYQTKKKRNLLHFQTCQNKILNLT